MKQLTATIQAIATAFNLGKVTAIKGGITTAKGFKMMIFDTEKENNLKYYYK